MNRVWCGRLGYLPAYREIPSDPEAGIGKDGCPEYMAPGIDRSNARITSGFIGTCVGGGTCAGRLGTFVNAWPTADSAAGAMCALLPSGNTCPVALPVLNGSVWILLVDDAFDDTVADCAAATGLFAF